MASVYTAGASGADWDLLVETAFNRAVSYYLRDEPKWRQMIDVRPDRVAMPGETIELTKHNTPMTLATTPLTETVDPDAVAPAAPVRVPITVHEYGNASIFTLFLDRLSFTQPPKELAVLLGRNMQDSVDAIVRAVADTSTNILWRNGGVDKTTGGSDGAVAATDLLVRAPASKAVALLRRNLAVPKMGTNYMALVHPDAAFDTRDENSATAWNAPHTVGGDTAAMYTGITGSFMGATYIETTRITKTATGVSGAEVYSTYYFGQEALAEVAVVEPHVVVGPVVDRLRRFNPLGWHCLFGQNIFRSEALVVVRTSSSIASL